MYDISTLYNLIFLINLDQQVEVMSVERQNELIHSCHYGVLDTLESKASVGHYGM